MLKSELPPDMFLRGENDIFHYGDFPDLEQGVDYFRSLIGFDDWRIRRERIARYFYGSITGSPPDPNGSGRFYPTDDLFGWYLFLGEALTEYPQHYEVFAGCRIVPILASIGRNRTLISSIDGFDDRARRLAGPERSQANGGLFELLVALAYARDGGTVAFRPEEKGGGKTYDMDVHSRGNEWAIECKRMEAGDYVERERARKLDLWRPASQLLVPTNRSIYVGIEFKVEIFNAPDSYIFDICRRFLTTGDDNILWSDEFSTGSIGNLDLNPLRSSLSSG